MGPGRNAYASLWLLSVGLLPAPIAKDINMHYYKFNISDYRKDTVHLTPMEHYIYRSLIDWYYLDELPIPEETHLVARRLCLGIESVSLLENVLNDFFKLSDIGYIHKRIDVEIAEYHDRNNTNSENGKKGGRPKKPPTKPKKTGSVKLANPDETEINPNYKLLTINQELITILSEHKVPVDSWNDFVKHRKSIKRPLSERSEDLAINKLAKLQLDGFNPKDVLEQSILNGYTGVFPVKGNQSITEKTGIPYVHWFDTEEATYERAKKEGVSTEGVDLGTLRVRVNDVIQSKKQQRA